MFFKPKSAPFDVCIIGGMGPAATAELMRRTVLYTEAKADAEHASVCVFNAPHTPDRSEYILSGEFFPKGKSARLTAQLSRGKRNAVLSKKAVSNTTPVRSGSPLSPLKAIKEQIAAAKKLRCRYFAVACNTAHYFYKDFEGVRGIKFINTVKETAAYAAIVYPEKELCVLATLGTVKADIYGTLSPKNAKIRYPSPAICEEIMRLIREIKAGRAALSDSGSLHSELSNLLSLLKEEFDTEKTVFILGCTELSLVFSCFDGLTVVDSTDVLAGKIISVCGKRFNRETFSLKAEYFGKIQE